MYQTAITAIQPGGSPQAVDITPEEVSTTSLDDRLRDAYASASVQVQAEYAHIMAKANDPAYLSEPGSLFALQMRVGEYSQKVQTIGVLTHKVTGTAETLLRA